MRAKFRLIWISIPLVLLFAIGCDSVSNDQKTMIDAGAIAAKERASSFRIERMIITGKAPADQSAVNTFLDSHGNHLNSTAKGLSDLSEALKKSSKISEQMKIQISNEASTVKTSMEDFIAMAPKLKAKDPADEKALAEWGQHHAEALTQQYSILAATAAKFTKQKAPGQ